MGRDGYPVHASERPVTPRRQQFVLEYLKDLCGAAAARRAGYAAHTADRTASRLLGNAEIRQAIEKAMQERATRVGIDADFVLRELKQIAGLNPQRFFDKSGAFRPIHELEPDLAGTLAGIETDEVRQGDEVRGVTRKLRFADKLRALDLLGKHLRLWDKSDGERPVTVIIRTGITRTLGAGE